MPMKKKWKKQYGKFWYFWIKEKKHIYHNKFYSTSVLRVYERDVHVRNANVHDVRDAKFFFYSFRILDILLTIGKNIIQYWSVMLWLYVIAFTIFFREIKK